MSDGINSHSTEVVRTICVVLLLVLGVAESSKILCIFPSPSRSHVLVGQALLKGLAQRGHEVTMVSPFKLSKPVKNYRDVTIPVDDFSARASKEFLEKPPNLLVTIPQMMAQMMDTANSTINDPKMLALKGEKFDLVIVGVFVADYILGFGPHFGAPTVVLWTAGLTKITADFVGNPRAISSVPHLMIAPQENMGFVARLKNLLVSTIENLVVSYSVHRQQAYYDHNFPPSKYPSYEAVRRNVSLMLLNTHFSHGGPRPYIQNTIEVGGLQIKQTPDPLPQDIQLWLDGAEHGAIYFCLGSNLKSADLPMAKLQIFLSSLGKLKQRILWKWEKDDMPDLPKNIMTKKWLPQEDVLAHKNVVLFITHGGLGGLAEARYHGVPVLGIPIFAEQSGNVESAVREGWGLPVDYQTLDVVSFSRSLDEILNNDRFRQKAKQVSDIYRDRPQGAMELACYWIEYVIRYKGAAQLHYQGADLNFIEHQMLDVILLLLAVVYVVYKLVKLLVKAIIRMVCGKSKKQKTN